MCGGIYEDTYFPDIALTSLHMRSKTGPEHDRTSQRTSTSLHLYDTSMTIYWLIVHVFQSGEGAGRHPAKGGLLSASDHPNHQTVLAP